jgi:hypothetical protein
MGGSRSKSVVDSVQTSISNFSSELVQECLVSVDQSQNVNIDNSAWFDFGGTTNIKQQTDVKSTCFSDSAKQVALQNAIQQIIKNAAEANGVGLTSVVGASQSAAETKLRSTITNNITMRNIQKNYNLIKQEQQVTIRNRQGIAVSKNINISQGADVFAAATLKTVESTGIINNLAAAIDNQSKATTANPLDFIGDIVGNVVGSVTSAISTVWIVIGVAIVAVIGIIAYFILNGGDVTQVTDAAHTTHDVLSKKNDSGLDDAKHHRQPALMTDVLSKKKDKTGKPGKTGKEHMEE